MEAIFSHYPRI